MSHETYYSLIDSNAKVTTLEVYDITDNWVTLKEAPTLKQLSVKEKRVNERKRQNAQKYRKRVDSSYNIIKEVLKKFELSHLDKSIQLEIAAKLMEKYYNEDKSKFNSKLQTVTNNLNNN